MISALLLGLAQGATAAPPLVQPYDALGHEPNWTLRIEGGQIRFSTPGRDGVSVALPPARTGTLPGLQESMAASAYEAPGLRFFIMHTLCIDFVGGRQYSDAVTVTLGDAEFQGCGGAPVPFDALHETNWRVVDIAGEAAPPADDVTSPNIGFSFGGYSGFGGCNHFNGRYRLAGDQLALQARQGSTGAGCDEAVINRQRRLMTIFGTPIRVNRINADTLELTGAAGTLRLARMPNPE